MLGDYAKGPAKEIAVSDTALYKEYGFEASEHDILRGVALRRAGVA